MLGKLLSLELLNVCLSLYVIQMRHSIDVFTVQQGAVVVVIILYLDLELPMQSVPITYLVSSNLAHGELYSILHYVIKFVSDL